MPSITNKAYDGQRNVLLDAFEDPLNDPRFMFCADPFIRRQFTLMRQKREMELQDIEEQKISPEVKEILGAECDSLNSKNWSPRVDFIDASDSLMISLELPGVSEDLVSVNFLDDSKIIVRGQKKNTKFSSGKDYNQGNRFFGTFERVFSVPRNSDFNRISSKMDNGVFEIVVPMIIA
ncbi:Small heat shock protein C2 [Smittium mucronatum]|uniref:Small heat shock protein C2 n=1 Tax=Smittium mucronatum TaxID=133383 RepID=A0A1R0GXZ3_9FUNG|nr:Small heat shock protein C2 [Smittium mucronatum]